MNSTADGPPRNRKPERFEMLTTLLLLEPEEQRAFSMKEAFSAVYEAGIEITKFQLTSPAEEEHF